MQRPPWGPILALVGVQMAFSTLPVVGKIVLDTGVPPEALAGIRVFFAGLVLAALAFRKGIERVAPRDLGKLLGLSLLGVTLNILFFIQGLKQSTPLNAAVLITTIPIFTLLVAILMRKEHWDGARAVGILLALAGTLVVLRADHFTLASGAFVGDLFIVGNCFSYSIYLVLVRGMLAKYRSGTVVALTFVLGGFILAPIGVLSIDAHPEVPWLRSDIVLGLLWIILVPSVLSYSLNNYALKHVRSSTVAGFVLLQPFGTALLSVLLRGDHLAPGTLLAGIPIFLGVLIVVWAEQRPGRMPKPSSATSSR